MTRSSAGLRAGCWLSALLLKSVAASALTLTGWVVGVADGDTITVLDANREQHRIRLAGIDAPEKAQPFGQRSKQAMALLVFGKEVEVEWQKHDRYQRIVGKVMVSASAAPCPSIPCARTLDVGLAQLSVGLAWWYEKYARNQSSADAGHYDLVAQAARARRAGLWSEEHPIAPWDWRKGER